MSESIRKIIRSFDGIPSLEKLFFDELDYEYANDRLSPNILSDSNRPNVSELRVFAALGDFKVILAVMTESRIDNKICHNILADLRRSFPYSILISRMGQAWAVFNQDIDGLRFPYIRLGDPDYYDVAEDLFSKMAVPPDEEDKEPAPLDLVEVEDEIFEDEGLKKLQRELKEETDEYDALKMYFRELFRFKPLTPDEIVDLFKYMETIKGFIDKTADEHEKARHIIDLNEIRDVLIQSNQRLVIWVAKKYVYSRLSLLDMIQEGNFGLMKAIEKFDYKLGWKFSTYAYFWIRQSIRREIDNCSNLVRLPEYVIESYRRARNGTATWDGSVPLWRITGIMQPPISVGPSGMTDMGFTLIDERSVNPFIASMGISRHDNIKEWLDYLTDKERTVIIKRFGLADGNDRTLEEIGQDLGLTRERIRQIEMLALDKLRFITMRKHIDMDSIL